MSGNGADPDERWVTLRDANAETGASVSALRKWYRKGTVRSEERDGPHGLQRYVWLADVKTRQRVWAEVQDQMGQPGPAVELELDSEHRISDVGPPPGMLLVPLEAWQRTLDTVAGGMTAVHQAGQELAAAREDAGVERTKREFLAGQLAEVRAAEADARARLAVTAAELEAERAKPRRRRWFGGG